MPDHLVPDRATDNPLYNAFALRMMVQTPQKVPFIPGDYLVRPAGLVLPVPPLTSVLKTKPVGELKNIKVSRKTPKIIK